MEIARLAFQAIGTHWDIKLSGAIKDTAWQQLQKDIYSRIEIFDKLYSRFRSDSLVTQMAAQPGNYQLPPDGYKMLQFYEQLYRATDGKVTPLIGKTMEEAGYDAKYSLQPKRLHRPPRWEDTLTYNKNSITLSQPQLLDFGAAGKGHLVDLVSELLLQAGIDNYSINAGGDILHYVANHTKLEVGLENPEDTSEVIGIVQLGNQSLCASAGSKRKWVEFTHIIDPVTLQSPDHILATWVVADDAMVADGLATALFFSNPDKLQKQFSFSYAILHHDMSLQYAKDFPITVFEAV